MGRYIKPYKKYMIWSVVLNFVSQWLSVFSFMALVPILNILFQVEEKHYEYKEIGSIFDEDAIATLKDNGYWYIQQLIAEHGQMYILLLMGTILIFMTGLRCGSYFVSSAIMIPFRTGVVKDMPASTGRKNMYVFDLNDGEYIRLRGVDFGSKGARQFAITAAATGTATVTLRLNSQDGPVIGTAVVSSTGSADRYRQFTAKVKGATGVHDLYLCFDRCQGDVRLDYWQFK